MPKTIEGIHYRTDCHVAVTVADGIIREIRAVPQAAESGERNYIGPGLVDLQINGYSGLDLNELPTDAERVKRLVRQAWREGITTFFPTITTNSDANLKAALEAVAKACETDPVTNAAVAGIHLEGPYISPEDGPRGAHKAEYVRAPDWSHFMRFQEAAGGRIRLVTLSPEWPGAMAFIRGCVQSGITVSIGHTAASPEQIREAAAAGATLSTHFGNGAHLQLPRHPNYLWEQLAEESLWVSLIADGFHLPESFLKVALAVKKEKAILVSDAVHLSGMQPGSYFSHKRVHVVLTPEGRLHLADQHGLLAGSAQMLPQGIGHLVRTGICGLEEAWEMASVRPSALLELPSRNGLSVGAPADLAVFSLGENYSVQVKMTYKQGELLYSI